MILVRKLLRKLGLPLLVILIVAASYVFWPRGAHLRSFNPAGVARLETAMWRDYYEHRYVALFRGLYKLNRVEYGFSPWDSLRVAYFAAKGAKVFQPTQSRAEAQQALPSLERFYGVIHLRSGEEFDPATAARQELDWWQLRREKAAPTQYGEVIAQIAEEIYGITNAQIREASVLRAEMMAYRDERSNGRMADKDWEHIEQNLGRSYELLKANIARSPAK